MSATLPHGLKVTDSTVRFDSNDDMELVLTLKYRKEEHGLLEFYPAPAGMTRELQAAAIDALLDADPTH